MEAVLGICTTIVCLFMSNCFAHLTAYPQNEEEMTMLKKTASCTTQ